MPDRACGSARTPEYRDYFSSILATRGHFPGARGLIEVLVGGRSEFSPSAACLVDEVHESWAWVLVSNRLRRLSQYDFRENMIPTPFYGTATHSGSID